MKAERRNSVCHAEAEDGNSNVYFGKKATSGDEECKREEKVKKRANFDMK